MEGYFSYSLLDLLARFASLQENNMHIKEERKENTTFFFFFQEKWSRKSYCSQCQDMSFLTVTMRQVGLVGFSTRTIRIGTYPTAIERGFEVFSHPAGLLFSVICRVVPSRITTVYFSKT